ncbi:porin family protein [Vibrio sp. ZSDE26]|uniref:Porin family protein n=1 Tax=Vibrio amylolyticus TaxID=2847292 RepID=A0A9X1XNW9_9VIBR|nr:outer membrane beta-barrel protein [Vibrio amylolyticus]MCK6264430.1 porin family protein [Vibrio amylolyticus]
MKKTVLALSMIVASMSTSVAAKEGAYVSGAYSMMYQDSIVAASNDVENGYALAAGYDFPMGSFFVLAAEVEYKNLGSTTETILSDSLKVSMSSYGVNVLPKIYLGDSFHVMAKLGFHKVEADLTSTYPMPASLTTASDTASLLGFGLGYDFTEHVALQTTYEIHNIAGYNTASANIGIKYSF